MSITGSNQGFTPYIGNPPRQGVLCRFWNGYNDEQWTGTRDELRPEFNVAYLHWKLTGIAVESMKRQEELA